MKIKVKQIHVMRKIYAENCTYRYDRAIIPINKVMTIKEYIERQKQAALKFGVQQNKIGGIYENLE